MLESYISPFLLGYVDKYIKNLKPEDLRLSLWGGDLVLNNLELRLDALEKDLNLPLSFVSGFIHELCIHVPWTRIGYEPAEITINTIECTLKLRDGGADDNDSVSSKSSTSTNKSKAESGSKAKPKEAIQDASLSPGYVTSLMNRVLHNVRVSVKNLILKYVEDDIVLSVNIQSFDTFATDRDWQKAFVELSLPELVLRRVCKFSDITVCLDKRNASGKIEVYQEPVVFRCAVTTRMHLTYNSLNAKRVSAVKVSTLCEELKLSLSDTQLPMFLRLMQLFAALYYGTLDLPGGGGEGEDGEMTQEQEGMKEVTLNDESDEAPVDLDPSNSWTSWAWSFVPEVMTYEDEEGQEGEEANRYGGGKLQKHQEPILSVGLYCNKATLEFKVTDPGAERALYTRPKISFHQTLVFQLGGVAIETLMKGEPFFAAQLGISHIRLLGIGSCPCGVKDFQHDVSEQGDDGCFLECGDPRYEVKPDRFLSLSLFDPDSPENNHQKTIYIIEGEHHQAVYTEQGALGRYGAFWMDYLFTYHKIRGLDGNDSSSRSSHHSDGDPIFTAKETSWKRFVLAPASAKVTSSLVHRLQEFIDCANNHDYEPYSTPKPEVVDETRPTPTAEQVSGLEEGGVPMRHTHWAVLGLDVTLMAAQHGRYHSDPAGANYDICDQPVVPGTAIPAVHVQCKRMDYQVAVPMYARALVKACSKVAHPSSTLLHSCYSHNSLKVFGLQCDLTFDPNGSDLSPPALSVLPPCSFAGLAKTMCLPMYWTDSSIVQTEVMLEVPSLRLALTKAQLLLLLGMQHSWMSTDQPNSWLQETTLMQDVFTATGDPIPEGQASLAVSMSSLELRYVADDCVMAVSGSLGQARVTVNTHGEEIATPVFEGPQHTSRQHLTSTLRPSPRHTTSPRPSPRGDDTCLLTFTAQLPRPGKDKGCLGAVLVKMEGTCVCLDPVIVSWLLYHPTPRLVTSLPREDPDRRPRDGTTGIRSTLKRASSQGSELFKGTKSGAKFSKQKSLTATPLMEEDEPGETEASGQKIKLETIISKLKELIIQVDVEPCVVVMPTEHLSFTSPDLSIPHCLRDLMTSGQGSDCPALLVLCVPCLAVHSSGHKLVDPSQDIPLSRMDLPQEPGEKLPWTVKAANLALYSIDHSQRVHYLLKPMAISTTLALTAKKQPPSVSADRAGVGLGIHTDMPAVVLKCSEPQVALVSTLLQSVLERQTDLLGACRFKSFLKPGHAPPTGPPRSPRGGDTLYAPSSPSRSVPHPPITATATSSQLDSTVEMQTVSNPSDAPPLAEGGRGGEKAEGGVSVSLWVQWTLHKVSCVMFGKDKTSASQQQVKLCADMEDLTSSIDLQDVYSKVNCKVGALNINHFVKSDNVWVPGPFQGVVLSCTDTMSPNVEMSSPMKRLRTSHQPSNPFSPHPSKAPEATQTHAFLSLTWTRALGTSIAQRMFGGKSEKNGDVSAASDESAKVKRYVNEVIVSSRSFDFVLWCPIIASTLDVLLSASPKEGGLDRRSEYTDGPTLLTIPEGDQKTVMSSDAMSWKSMSHRSIRSLKSSKSTQRSSGIADWLVSSKLPLVYLDCKEIRTFIPASHVDQKGRGTDAGCLDQDLFLFQVSQISLVPYADNPLERLVLKEDIFRKATLAGITQQPGSEVEDRQYQLDVTRVSLTVASWEQVMRASEHGRMRVGTGVTRSKTQNPALEWNLSLPKHAPEQVQLTPVIKEFDLHLTAAPAIVMEKVKPDKTIQKVVVCGHSLEFNMLTDLTIYLSTQQVHLAHQVLGSNLHHLLQEESPMDRAHHPHQDSQEPSSTQRASLQDSGFGSSACFSQSPTDATRQTASMTPPSSSIPTLKPVLTGEPGSVPQKKKSRMKGVTPFDFLMTGRKIAVFLYSCKPEQDQKDKAAMEGKKPPMADVLVPFLHLELSQPSLFMLVEKQAQKVDLSFYDFKVAGATREKEIRGHNLPQEMDFPVPWFQTTSGRADPKTGVKPALFTLTVSDFMMQTGAVVKVEVGRPLKVNFSLTKLQQAREYLKTLQPIRMQDVTKEPLEATEIRLMTTPKSGEKLVGISLPGQQSTPDEKPGKTQTASAPDGVWQDLMMLSNVQTVVMATSQVVLVIATTPDPDFPHLVASVGGTLFESEVVINQKTNKLHRAQSLVQVADFMLKTSLQQHTRPLVGPVSFDLSMRTNHEPHSFSELRPWLPRIFADINVQNVPIVFGQEHLNCLTTVVDRMAEELGGGAKGGDKKEPVKKLKVKIRPSAALKPRDAFEFVDADDLNDEDLENTDDLNDTYFVSAKDFNDAVLGHTHDFNNAALENTDDLHDVDLENIAVFDDDDEWEDVEEEKDDEIEEDGVPEGVTQVEYKDDLRTGAFEYFTEGKTDEDIPLPNQIFFTPPSPEGGHWGTMCWTYPEPRMDVAMTITPIPINNPDIPSITKRNKIPCVLQVYNARRQVFTSVSEFFVSETHRYHKKQRIEESRDIVEELEAHSTWRVLLNASLRRHTMRLPLNRPTPDVILTPMSLAASMRFDTIFAPRFIQFCYVNINLDLVELRLANHRSQLGKSQPDYLKPFVEDGATPNNQEFLVTRLADTKLTVEGYGGVHARTRICGDWSLSADLLNYSDLTMTPLLAKVGCEIGNSFRGLADVEGTISCGMMTFMAGQNTIHTLTKAAQAWTQNQKPDAEQLYFGYYLICNATDQTLRFGQTHTDESLILESGKLHEYSWRSHKQAKAELHVCIEGWHTFRWSEPFGMDGRDGETLVRVLHNKNQTATLFIQVRSITGMQRQIIISGAHNFTSQLSIPLDVQIIRASGQASARPSTAQDTLTLAPGSSLPAMTCRDDDITGVRVRVQGSECDWSEQFAHCGEMSSAESVIKVPCHDGRKFYFWCQIFSEDHEGYTKRLVVLSPLFLLQSHMPRPLTIQCQAARGNDTQVIEVRGQGSIHQLHQVPPMAWYNLTFSPQSDTPEAPGTSTSSAVCISTEMFGDVTHQPEEAVGLREIADGPRLAEDLTPVWPYNHTDYSSSMLHSLSLQNINVPPNQDAQGHPHASLQVGMVQHRAKVNTIRLEIMPWCLLVNETGMECTIQAEGGEPFNVTAGTTVSPPKFAGKFTLLLTSKGESFSHNDQIQLVDEPGTPPKNNEPTQDLQLKPVDYMTLELVSRGEQPTRIHKVVHMVIQSTRKHNMRVLTLRPRFIFRNDSKLDVRMRLVNLKSQDQIALQPSDLQSVILPSKSTDTPTLMWKSPVSSQPMGSFHYLSVASADQSEWSAWVEVQDGSPRVPFSLPVVKPSATFQSKGIVTAPMIAMVYQHEGVTFVTLDDDPSPKVLVINRCPFPVHVGQSHDAAKAEDAMEIEEERVSMPRLPMVPPNAAFHYNPPRDFHASPSNIHKFHFAVAKPPGSLTVPSSESLASGGDVRGHEWSEAVDIWDSCNPTRSEIVAMPTGGYLLVATECVGTLIHVFLEALDHAEEKEAELLPDPPQISQSISTAGVTVMVMNDLTPGSEVKEVLRLTAKQVCLVMVGREDLKRTKALHAVHLVQFTIGAIQLDNQTHAGGSYDFPVLFKGHSRSKGNTLPEIDPDYQLTPERWYNFVYCEAQESRETSFLSFHVFVEGNRGFGDRLRNAEIALNDMEVYIEDQFLHDAKALMGGYSPGLVVPRRKKESDCPAFSVQQAMSALRSPIGLQQLTIHPVALTASIHASLKMFISLEQTKLSFPRYETGPIYATHRQLGQALTLHYTSGALLKAGWAIGSLDILGNPAGFLRNVRTGLFDTVYLPYEGLTRGPSAFVSGVASGMSSLVRHLSAGTLSSITKFASSLSRNLDRLSLDADHRARRDEERRRVPEGMSSGIAQGLSSFGISLLGAIAGIADQPLRGFQEVGSDPVTPMSHSQRARGVISGVGRGLVGAVIKPLGGAAEFVAQTGQGILHGTGLAEKLTPLAQQHCEVRSAARNSALKYQWKMLCTLLKSEVLCQVDMTSTTVQGLQRGGALLLTPLVLYVVSASEDTPQVTFAVCDIDCRPVRFNAKGLKLIYKAPVSVSAEQSPPTADRVADYVASTSDTSGHDEEPREGSDSPGESSGQRSQEAVYQYEMKAPHREMFLAMFSVAKARQAGLGFCYDQVHNVEYTTHNKL